MKSELAQLIEQLGPIPKELPTTENGIDLDPYLIDKRIITTDSWQAAYVSTIARLLDSRWSTANEKYEVMSAFIRSAGAVLNGPGADRMPLTLEAIIRAHGLAQGIDFGDF